MTPSGVRFALAAVVALAAAGSAAAAPRDEALRLAPPDAALVLLVQNARDHVAAVAASPFAEWFPTSALGKQLGAVGDLRSTLKFLTPVLDELGTTPDELLNDVLGDAVVFAFSPAPPGKPTDERAVILVRPRKPETLARIVERVNAAQMKAGELKGVAKKTHAGEQYFERQKPLGPSEFYCFRGGVFAFSSTEADITAVIDRDKAAPRDGGGGLTERLEHLGVAHALAVLLINPRQLDAEFDAQVAAAKPDDRVILERFREVWKATEAAAVYLALDRELEIGVSVRFDARVMPAWARGWLAGPKTPSALWAAVPDDALAAVGGRFKAAELLELVLAVLPEDGKKALSAAVADTLGPIVGKDKLPLVLEALGPDWAVWAEPPRGDGFLPVVVAAVRVNGDGPDGKATSKAIGQAVEYGFFTFRVAYNAGHKDQIELREEQDGTTTIVTLVNDAGFPSGFRPSFALKGGYLLVTTDPDAIRRFRPPSAEPKAGGEVLVARFNGAATRAHLKQHGPRLAKFLAGLGQGDEKEMAALLEQLAVVLEPVDRVEVVTRSDESSLRVAVRVKLVKPLKK